MKERIFSTIFFIFSTCTILLAAEYTEQTSTETTGQIRFDFTYHLPLRHDMALTFFEDLRLDMLPFHPVTLFDLSLTSVTFSYSPVQYVKLDAGYMLKISGPGSADSWNTHWSIINSFIKHRLYASVTGSYTAGAWRFALREQFLCDMRFDDIDTRTARHYALTLRHFINISYNIKSKNLSPYVWTELANTLNAPEYCQKNGRQYLERWRNCAGIKWKIIRENAMPITLNFFYRYDWGCFRSAKIDYESVRVNIKRKDEHALGIGVEI
ncbi:MAG: DUF2490 domain-containing protein [Paludibacteraceae bacterium]|nr:DUF2490 domain-containing protein [Paludibacteraceae bacterium]